MIRKNAVQSILAERDILISVRNPFVVRRPAIYCSFMKLLYWSNFHVTLMNRFDFSTLSHVGKIFI